jgi:hypothetical protein
MTRDKHFLFILVTVTFAGGFFYFIYHYTQNNISPRNLRSRMAAPKKRKAVPWKTNLEAAAPTATATPEKTPLRETDYSAYETSKLFTTVEEKMKKHWRLSVEEIDKKLAMTDELISRNPDMYSLYKAKLILLLTKQNLHKLEVDESEIEDILATMASFDIVSEKALQKEAFLVARTNQRIETLMDEVDGLEDEMEEADAVDVEAILEQKIEEKLIEMEDLENQLEEGLLAEKDFINEDVVDIPMHRALAMGDYDEVIDQAEALLDEYPNSISGHYFKIRALRLSGANDEVREYLSTIQLAEDEIKELEDRVNLNTENDPKDFWKRLRFQ